MKVERLVSILTLVTVEVLNNVKGSGLTTVSSTATYVSAAAVVVYPAVVLSSVYSYHDHPSSTLWRGKREEDKKEEGASSDKGGASNNGVVTGKEFDMGETGSIAKVPPPPTGAVAKNSTTTTVKTVKEKTLVIPDRTPVNMTVAQIKELTKEEDEDNGGVGDVRPGQNNFDDKAIQRTLIVLAGIAVIIVAYLGIKFALIRKRKVAKRYGRIESSEMDLLDEIDDDGESEEEEELFDISQHQLRRS